MDRITVIPYLTFYGQCEEAVSAYIRAFGGEVYYQSRWSAEAAGMETSLIGKVMHIEFALGNTRMAAGDASENERGNAKIKLMIHMNSMEEADRAVKVLAEGGEIVSALQPHPAPDDGGCGSITRDRFGYLWIITCPNPDKR